MFMRNVAPVSVSLTSQSVTLSLYLSTWYRAWYKVGTQERFAEMLKEFKRELWLEEASKRKACWVGPELFQPTIGLAGISCKLDF